ncbi:uncharacterized protein LOC144578685 [Callithrix jacchus]
MNGSLLWKHFMTIPGSHQKQNLGFSWLPSLEQNSFLWVAVSGHNLGNTLWRANKADLGASCTCNQGSTFLMDSNTTGLCHLHPFKPLRILERLRQEICLNLRGGDCCELRLLLHSRLGNRARLHLKKK